MIIRDAPGMDRAGTLAYKGEQEQRTDSFTGLALFSASSGRMGLHGPLPVSIRQSPGLRGP